MKLVFECGDVKLKSLLANTTRAIQSVIFRPDFVKSAVVKLVHVSRCGKI